MIRMADYGIKWNNWIKKKVDYKKNKINLIINNYEMEC